MRLQLKWTITLFFIALQLSFAQQVSVSGTVKDDEGLPLPGVTILVKGTKQGTQTDFDGNYSIATEAGKTLVFSFVGMKTVEKKIQGGGKTLKVNALLKTDAQELDAVVVTGITTTDKRLFTGASDNLKADDVKLAGIADISRGLEGRSAGVSVQNVSGTFGAAPKIRIRGATSILGSSKPLWVLDGVIVEDVVNVDADALASGDPNTLISSAIAGLNPEDIESFQVLKDGSATSIYGARAMAGVIVITTKKGRAGVSSFNYTSEYTNRFIPSYDEFNLMNSQEQMGIYQEMKLAGWLSYSHLINDDKSGVYGKMYQNLYKTDPKTGNFILKNTKEAMLAYLREAERRNTNWFNELFNYNIMQSHSVSISSGSEKSTYYASISLLNDPGWTKSSNVNRYTANLNASYKILNNLKLNLISSGSYRKQKAPGTLASATNVVSGAIRRDFDINPFTFALNTVRTLDPKEYYTMNYAPFNISHELENNYMDMNVANLKFQGEFTWDITKGLTGSFLGAINYTNAKTEHHITEFSNQAESYRINAPNTVRDKNPRLYKDPDEKFGVKQIVLPEGGIYENSSNELLAYNFRGTLQYNTQINNIHTVNTFLGAESNSSDRHYNWLRGYGLQYSRGEIPFFDYKIFKKLKEQGSQYYEITNSFERNLAFFGNLTYSYKAKYTLNGTLRYEGSNQLGKSRRSRWLPTWNIAGSWNAHEESFFNKVSPTLSTLRLKASYSLTADRGPASNSAIIIRSNTPWRHKADIQEGALYISDLENSELTYEKKTELNVGAELGFFNNRIGVNVDWYRRNNYDLIGPIETQGIGGVVKKLGNVAAMKSNGVELSVSTQNIKTDNFSWTTNFVYSHIKNEVTELNNSRIALSLVSGSGYTKKGYPVRSLFSYSFQGLNDEGLPTFIDQTGNVSVSGIDPQERDNLDFLVFSGSADPTDVGSFGNIFTYKGVKLNIFLTYSFGNVVRLYPYFKNQYSELDVMPREFNNRWVISGDENITNVPVIATKRQNENDKRLEIAYNAYNYSTERVADGSFIRLKEISLGYDFQKYTLEKLKLKNLSVKLQGTNLFLLYADKKLNGQDPEFINSGGVALPIPKQITFTLRAGL